MCLNTKINSSKQYTNWILRTFKSRSSNVVLFLFKTFVIPKLEYGCQVWSPYLKKDIIRVESLQKTLTSKIEGLDGLNYHQRLKHLKLYSMQRRRERYALIFIWKCAVGLVSGYSLDFNNNLRRGRLCAVRQVPQKVPTSVRQASEASLAVHGARLFNLLPRDVRDMVLSPTKSVLPFKRKLDRYLSTIPDQPTIQGRRRPANSNSLLDQIPMTVRSM